MANQTERLYYLDWLRVLAFGLLFIFHAARFFDDFGWHVKNDEHSMLVNLLVGFTHGWRMHLIFFISGVGTYFALKSSKGAFVKNRFKRLLIPYVFGIIFLIPPQKFLEAIYNEWFTGGFMDFIIGYPAWLKYYHPGVTLEWTGHLGLHVWYLAFLFVMTLVFLPVLKLVSKPNLINRALKYLSNHKLGLLIFIAPVVVTEVLLRPNHGDYLNWADFFQYGMFFVAGYIFMTHKGFIETSRKYTYLFLIAGIASSVYILTHYPAIKEAETTIQSSINSLILVSSSFSWVLFFFGLSQRKLNFNHKYLNSLNIGILPVYILHQTVIIVIGFYVVQSDYSILAKYTMILISSLFVTLALYQIIRRFNTLRFLFGMKVMVLHKKSKQEENGNAFFRNFFKRSKTYKTLKMKLPLIFLFASISLLTVSQQKQFATQAELDEMTKALEADTSLAKFIGWHGDAETMYHQYKQNLQIADSIWHTDQATLPTMNIGQTETFELIPLIDWFTTSDSLKGENGVSYLIKTDEACILFDLGLNPKALHPSPLLHNMKKLGISMDSIDVIVLSHKHADHVGGPKWSMQNTFSLSNYQKELNDMPVYTPTPMTYPGLSPEYTPKPTIIAKGVATIGVINKPIFLNNIAEQALAINVKDKGLVIISGCGHQSIEKIIQRTGILFDEAIYGMIGGFHFPMTETRNITWIYKYFVVDKMPWEKLTDEDINYNIGLLQDKGIEFIGFSGHDSCDRSLGMFETAFGKGFTRIVVGQAISLP